MSRAAAAGVDRAVLVQADDSAADTEAMFEVAAAHPEIAGVVAWVPLDRPDEAAARLDRTAQRGRASPASAPSSTTSPTRTGCSARRSGKGLALLERSGIPFDVISVLPRHLSHVPVLSERYPALRMVLDHLSHPPLGGADTSEWRTLITAAARNPLVFAKVSGLYPPIRRGPPRTCGTSWSSPSAVRAGPADVRQRLAGGRARRRLRQGAGRTRQALRPAPRPGARPSWAAPPPGSTRSAPAGTPAGGR